ncbi:MAG: F0F1 ATP synthase subunit epsilon [Chloroflexi bacterium RBG_13_60_13]|nr:MAG: F0F1 ATP synthase subunit epsilon [Chloroflexi bacterium RBG_13_60_13]
MARLKLEIVTAESPVYSGEVDSVIAPGVVGQFTILPHHAAFMTMLEPGELCVRQSGEELFIAVSGGFLEVRDNKVVVLADTAERADDIDAARAEAAKRRAEEQLKHPAAVADLATAEAALRRSLARLKVAEKRRKREKRPI